MRDIELGNLQQIELLNQRGGRTLSIVDLMRAGTISADMAAFSFCAVRAGASLLTAARPGGAGKTTLMAAMLAFLPRGEELRTVGNGASRVPRGNSRHGRECLLCHEIGQGLYFGYLWGREAAAFFQANARGVRVASNLHADTIEDIYAELTRPEIAVAESDLARVGLVAFMAMRSTGAGVVRRVSSLHAAADSRRRLLWEWDEAGDAFHWRGPGEPRDLLGCDGASAYDEALRLLSELRDSGPSDYAAVREELAAFPCG